MKASDGNNVKIYNLSAGKSLPEWLTDRKKRALQKKDVDIRRRIELIQDFDMPGVSTTVKVSNDGQYVLATGIYKPRIKCFDVNNLSQKFERCFDSEAVTFEILSDDYSKLVFLQCDRYVEFHAAFGRHYRLRIPKFGRDMKYHYPSCDLFICGSSPDIYRLNLERGQFMTPVSSSASAINKLIISPIHGLIFFGTEEGKVEAWDPRTKSPVASLDCAFSLIKENPNLTILPSITALQCNGGVELGVGVATGHVQLYDIRHSKPVFIKDHMNEFPIKDIYFHQDQELVYSMDKTILKIWNKNNGKLYTSIESSADLNNLCVVPNSGLLFMANEAQKILTYYIPSLGRAPKWASFLDSLTEELEETNYETMYDDYKFVTKKELEDFGLEHLVGTNILRPFMHGFFMDIRLYKKAKSLVEPFEFDKYRQKVIRDTIEKDRASRAQVEKLPSVNRDLALKLLSDQNDKKKKKMTADTLLEDNRFKALFKNPDFEVDRNCEEYRLLNPVLSKLDTSKKKELKKKLIAKEFEAVSNEELEGRNSSDESGNDFESSAESEAESEEESSEDEHTWTEELKKQHRILQREHRLREKREEDGAGIKKPQLFELRQGEEFKGIHSLKRKTDRAPLGERVEAESASVRFLGSVGNREMTFSTVKKKGNRRDDLRNQRHREERKKLIRPLNGIKSKYKGFFNRKRK